MDAKLKLVKAQIKRLRESVERLEAYTALQIDHEAVLNEIGFTENIVSAIDTTVEKEWLKRRTPEMTHGNATGATD